MPRAKSCQPGLRSHRGRRAQRVRIPAIVGGKDIDEQNFALRRLLDDVQLAVVVNDAEAVYPVRIDPTFSDANWVGIGRLSGMKRRGAHCGGRVGQHVVSGGWFTTAGGARPITSRNGTGAVGQPSVRGFRVATTTPSMATAAPLWLRWRCRTARCMLAAISRMRAAARPIASPNGTGAVGRPSAQGLQDQASTSIHMCMRWRCRAARYMRAVLSRRRVALRPMAWRNGTGAVGRPSVRGLSLTISNTVAYRSVYALAVSGSTLYAGGWFRAAGGSAAEYIAQWNGSSWSPLGSGMSTIPAMCMRWRCRAAHCMQVAFSQRRAALRPITLRNRTGAVGPGWVRGCRCRRRWTRPGSVCAGGVGQHVVCGWRFHDGGRQRGQ